MVLLAREVRSPRSASASQTSLETRFRVNQLPLNRLVYFAPVCRSFVAAERDALEPSYDTRSVTANYGGEDEGDGCVAPTRCEKVVKGIESSARVLKAQNKAAEFNADLPRKPKGAGRGSGEPPP